jgi:hypothetical protein
MLKGALKLHQRGISTGRINSSLLPHSGRKQQFCLCDQDAWGQPVPNPAGVRFGASVRACMLWLWSPAALCLGAMTGPQAPCMPSWVRAVLMDSDLEQPNQIIYCCAFFLFQERLRNFRSTPTIPIDEYVYRLLFDPRSPAKAKMEQIATPSLSPHRPRASG